jgi:hypothetical protein
MRAWLEALAGRLVFWTMAALTVGYILQLGDRANGAMRAELAAARSGDAPADQLTTEHQGSRLVIHLDRAVSPKALAEGWSGPEPRSGTWSVGKYAVLRIAGAPAGPAEVAVTLQPFIPPDRPLQRVTVRAEQRVLGQWRLTDNQVRRLNFAVPAEARDAQGDLVLAFDLPDADSPARRVSGSLDGRVIAIKLITVEVAAGGA